MFIVFVLVLFTTTSLGDVLVATNCRKSIVPDRFQLIPLPGIGAQYEVEWCFPAALYSDGFQWELSLHVLNETSCDYCETVDKCAHSKHTFNNYNKTNELKTSQVCLKGELFLVFHGCYVFTNKLIKDDQNYGHSASLIVYVENNFTREYFTLQNITMDPVPLNGNQVEVTVATKTIPLVDFDIYIFNKSHDRIDLVCPLSGLNKKKCNMEWSMNEDVTIYADPRSAPWAVNGCFQNQLSNPSMCVLKASPLREPESPQAEQNWTPIILAVILIGTLLVIVGAGICMWYLRVRRNPRPENVDKLPLPENIIYIRRNSESAPMIQNGEILLVCGIENEAMKEVVHSIEKLLECNGKIKVLNVFSTELNRTILNTGYDRWLNKIRESQTPVLILETPFLAQMLDNADVAELDEAERKYMMPGYQPAIDILKGLRMQSENERLKFCSICDFSGLPKVNNHVLRSIALSVRYTLPDVTGELVKRLCHEDTYDKQLFEDFKGAVQKYVQGYKYSNQKQAR